MRVFKLNFTKVLQSLSTAGTLCLTANALAESAPTVVFPADQIEFFEKSIRPVLAESCLDCHGGHRHENGLRLDSRAAILRGSDYGVVAEAGNPAASKLLQAMKHAPGVEAMPKKAPKLTDTQIAAFEKWISMGLPWPQEKVQAGHADAPAWQEHWAFLPVKKPALPAAPRLQAEVTAPMDQFVAAKLEKAGLSFAAPADRAALARRLYLDLTGLLPSYADVQAYVQDPDPKATAKLIDRLLDSPRYGERWARHWLDVARYAETEGYRAGGVDIRYPHAYTYRDWVISALNQDLPYDQFIKQQLAADRLLPAGQADPSLAALGFLTVNDSFQGDRLLQTDDRIDVVTRGTMGLTVSCARCHDHKYDPIPAKDYYAMASIFNSSQIPDQLPIIGEPLDQVASKEFKSHVGDIEEQMKTLRSEVYTDLRKQDRLRDYLVFAQRSLNLEGDNFRAEAAKAQMRDRLAARWKQFLKTHALNDKPHPVMLAWNRFAALPEGEFAAKGAAIAKELGADNSPANPVIRQELAKRGAPKNINDVAAMYSDVFLNCTTGTPPDNADWRSIKALLSHNASPMSVPMEGVKQFFTRNDQAKMTKLENAITKLEINSPGAPQRAMVMEDREKPSDGRVMIRGNPGRLGAPAPRGFLTFLGGQQFKNGSGRLELAEAITSKDNPLTARVMVNRVWNLHFGAPLVSQMSDFGVQTPLPEQAELLDYLSAVFMESGWSIKHLHRIILNSRTYQQNTTTTPEKLLKDPENALLSRFNRQRLDYEAMRDSMLQVSGALDVQGMGGRPTVLNDAKVDSRRSVYLFVDRFEQATVPAIFDFANPDTHSPQRFVTSVPQQTLFLMNSPFMKSRADQVAARTPVDGSTPDARSLTQLYEQVLLRKPSPEEVDLAARFVGDAKAMQAVHPFTWEYGYGNLTKRDDKNVDLQFQAFAKFLNDKKSGTRWQGGDKYPNPQTGYTNWTRSSTTRLQGHPGNGPMANILRWTAPADASIRVRGSLSHITDRGDGVIAWIISSREGVLLEKHFSPRQARDLTLDTLQVKAGDVLSFCVTCGGNTDSDSFAWTPRIERQDDPATGFTLWTDSARDFCGPDRWPLGLPRPQNALSQLSQVLMMSNEFQFID